MRVLLKMRVLVMSICIGLPPFFLQAQDGDILEDIPNAPNLGSSDLESGILNRRLDLNGKFWGKAHVYNLLSEKEILDIRAHIVEHGRLLSVHELQRILPDISRIRELAPFIRISGTEFQQRRPSNIDVQVKWDNAPTVTCRSCDPSPVHIRLRSEIQVKKGLRIGLVGETDRGEPVVTWSRARLFDLQKGYLTWNKGKTQLIAGHHHIRYGEGLFSNNFYLNKVGANPLGIKGDRSAILPSRSFMEDPSLGVAAHSRFRNLELITGVSATDRDAVIDPVDGSYSTWREGGLHRTQGERSAKNKLRSFSADLHIKFQLGQFDIGLSYRGEHFSHKRLPILRPDQVLEPFGQRFHDLGMSYNYQGPTYFLFGEWKSTSFNPPSFLQGALVSLGRSVDLSVMIRNYRPDHTYWSSSAFGAQSANKNELGIYGGVSFRYGKYRTINFVFDQYTQPWFAYGYKRGTGAGERIIITCNDRWGEWKILGQFLFSEKRRNEVITVNYKLRFAAQRAFDKKLRIGLRTDLSREARHISHLLTADLIYTVPRGRLFLRTYQSFGSGNQRFYMRENDLQNSFALTTFNGRIRRNYVMWEVRSQRRFKMRIKTWSQRDLSQPNSHSFGVNLQFLNQW